ncbi:SAM-dependent methyltransferase [Bacillus sp. FJAT-42376]|uniref:SAM-dependent methyltransferase n=1 Tax=Bacillus sp. FJAT-42376 TaxID=2014076 RepID=UPI000F4E6AB9|nr:SAM-dependent methyltransferase [Bacillus sp. FJAT-42376]AZB43609.1 SAM-dependent methyltransferase [Bacillus sp. FJAT-42376]
MVNVIFKNIERNKGFLPFDDYMEMSLYDPDAGYYMSRHPKIGKEGDFYTTSSVSKLYGVLVARWFIKKTETGEIPPVFCEAGSGTGKFIRAFLEEWEKQSPDSYKEGKVFCIEKSPYHSLRLQHLNVSILSSLSELPDEFSGVIFSNELFDAMPVKLVEMDNGQPVEIGVGTDDHGSLVFKQKEGKQDYLIAQYLEWSGIKLQEGYRAEVPLAMLCMLEEMNHKMRDAYVITADYGHFSEQLNTRREGTIRGFKNHTLISNPLAYPFEMDLTYDIPLDVYLKKTGEFGWQDISVQKQSDFFWGNGLSDFLEDTYDPNPFSGTAKQNRAIRSLLSQEGMSESFYIMIHKKRG